MALIGVSIEPDGVARMFFDMQPARPDPNAEARIAAEIETAQAHAAPPTERAPLPRRGMAPRRSGVA